MSTKTLRAMLASALMGVVAVGAITGCERDGPAENVGESIDRGVDNVGDAIDPAGPAEKAGEAVDDAVNR